MTGDLKRPRGKLLAPADARGLVIFLPGNERSARANGFVARFLAEVGFASLLIDTAPEQPLPARVNGSADRERLSLLTDRAARAVEWARRQETTAHLGLGYFGSDQGAAAALAAASRKPGEILAVVSMSGRPDLIGEHLGVLRVPTLLIVGGCDSTTTSINRAAMELLPATDCALDVVDGASHDFEEAGTLQRAAELAAGWYHDYLVART